MEIQLKSDFHNNLLKEVKEFYPILHQATRVFNKRQSQFMYNTLTLSHLTDIRSARQCLAEIKKARLAVEEAFFKIRKKEVRIKKKERERDKVSDELDKELLDIEVVELETQIKNISENVEGAIRKMSALIKQYKTILERAGKESFSEEDFEKDEERYHIMKAFEQGLHAAVSHGGAIDEGNLVYLFQLGISDVSAQVEVSNFLAEENRKIKKGENPSHKAVLNWLYTMAEKYKGSAKAFSEHKGQTLVDHDSLLPGG